MLPDYHIHTPLCGHARGSLTEYVEAARRLGLTELCFTDHAPAPCGYDSRHRMSMHEWPTYLSLVGDAAACQTVTVLRGVEADYYDGCEAFLTSWLAEQGLDLVLGSVHFSGSGSIDHPDGLPVWKTADRPGAWEGYLDRVGELAATGLYDVAAHLDLPKRLGRGLSERVLRGLAPRALDPLAEMGMSLELNTSGLRRPAGEIYPTKVLLDLAREREIPITFGSDAHSPEEVGYEFARALALARAAGYTHRARYRQRQRELVPLPDGPDL